MLLLRQSRASWSVDFFGSTILCILKKVSIHTISTLARRGLMKSGHRSARHKTELGEKVDHRLRESRLLNSTGHDGEFTQLPTGSDATAARARDIFSERMYRTQEGKRGERCECERNNPPNFASDHGCRRADQQNDLGDGSVHVKISPRTE